MFTSTPPISIDGPSRSETTHHLDTSDVLHMHRVSSCDKRRFYVPYLQLLLTVCVGRRVTINILPDDVLLHIFHFDRVIYLNRPKHILQVLHLSWRWHRLIHVCRRWRSIVFASPNFLDLKLIFGPRTRVGLPGTWPPLPIVIGHNVTWHLPEDYDFDAAIVHRNRVHEIDLRLTRSQFERLASAMEEEFPALIHLNLTLIFDDYADSPTPAPALPDGFLGGSAPSLQSLTLDSIAFPALPEILLTANGLVRLTLRNIPHSWYFSHDAIVTALAVLANLESLTVEFEYTLSLPNPESRRPLPPNRTVLPALTYFEFEGVNEYLEDLVARIVAPRLQRLNITFFNQIIFDTPQFIQFICHTPTLKQLENGHLNFQDRLSAVNFSSRGVNFRGPWIEVGVLCRAFDWQVSSLEQVCTVSLPPLSTLENLYIYEYISGPYRQDNIDNLLWLELLHPFTTVKNLYLSKEFARHIVPALQERVGGRTTEVLPTLQNIFLEGLEPSAPIHKDIANFVSARQVTGHHIAVSRWDNSTEDKLPWHLMIDK